MPPWPFSSQLWWSRHTDAARVRGGETGVSEAQRNGSRPEKLSAGTFTRLEKRAPHDLTRRSAAQSPPSSKHGSNETCGDNDGCTAQPTSPSSGCRPLVHQGVHEPDRPIVRWCRYRAVADTRSRFRSRAVCCRDRAAVLGRLLPHDPHERVGTSGAVLIHSGSGASASTPSSGGA
jgi:hypothetical protein